MVIAAAYANGIFLENTVVRGGFSGVQKLDTGSLKKSCNLAGVGGDSAHSLEIVAVSYTHLDVYKRQRSYLQRRWNHLRAPGF